MNESQLYGSLWRRCDELRGDMDVSRFKDYVLCMLFIKYISDRDADPGAPGDSGGTYGSAQSAPAVTIPPGSSFADMVRLKGRADIGDRINTQIIQPLIDHNPHLVRSDFPDFNDAIQLGEGTAMVDRLTRLISIFEMPELDFSQRRADHDENLAGAYRYLLEQFGKETGSGQATSRIPVPLSRQSDATRDPANRSVIQINVSPRVAGCGCFAISGLAILAGCVLMLIVVWGFLVPNWKTNFQYAQSSGLVLDKRLTSEKFDLPRPGGKRAEPQEFFRPEIKIRYEVNGRPFEVWTYDGGTTYSDRDSQQAILDGFQVGSVYPCWYDPHRPDQAVLVRGHSWGAYVFLILPVGLLLVGSAGIFFAWKTASMPAHRDVAGDA